MPDRTADNALDPLDLPVWDRRGAVRRADDRTLREKCMTLAREIGVLLGVLAALVGMVFWLSALMGVTLSGPPQAIATLARQQDSLTSRVTRLEIGQQSTRDQLHDLTGDVRFLSYLLCVKDHSQDAVAIDRCKDIILALRPRGTP